MPAERVVVRKIKDMLRLKWDYQLCHRQETASCAVARSTVAETLRRAAAAGLIWPLPTDLTDAWRRRRGYARRRV